MLQLNLQNWLKSCTCLSISLSVQYLMQRHNWIDFGHIFHFFVWLLQGTHKKRMTTCKIILTPTTKEPKICHALATTSAFNLKLQLQPVANMYIMVCSVRRGVTHFLRVAPGPWMACPAWIGFICSTFQKIFQKITVNNLDISNYPLQVGYVYQFTNMF